MICRGSSPSIDVEDEQVSAHRLEEAFAVALVADAGDDLDPRRLALLVRLAFLLGDLLDVDACAEGEAIAVRRPDRRARAALERGQLAWLAALERQQEQLRACVVAVRQERQRRCHRATSAARVSRWRPLVSARGGLVPSKSASISCER